ncbi:MAG: ABC transporter substrate-binding protein [Ignisphaera sp.]|nr:ABC transporter substrate-binding protein [Ignisphaera sp.]MCX8167605.1 ABC transporter substrate-binding protein [Ignisphaera sp.]MDW8085425.1 ABC transporter substrate-binding protein [Ignisphaera sp.]
MVIGTAVLGVLYTIHQRKATSTNTPIETITASPTPSRKIVVYAYRDAITGIDPSVDFDTGIVVLGNVYEPLLYYDPTRGEFKPALATSWSKINETAWLFILRKGVVFHDGTPLTGEAVRFSIIRSKLIYEEKGIGPGWIWDCLEDIYVVNNTAVLFKLRYPAPMPLIASSAYGAFIYSPNVLNYANAIDMLDDRIRLWFESGKDAGSGPYRVLSYKPESEVVLEKFDEWWGWSIVNNSRAPDIAVIKIVEEPAAQELGLLDGSIHIATNVAKANIPRILGQGYGVINQTTFHNFVLMFNVKRWPTNITEFRKAILHAIPWDRVVDFAFQGFGRSASGIIPFGYPGYATNLRYEYNMTRAREILGRLNVSNVKLEFVIVSGYEEEERFASLLKSSLNQLDIDVDIVALPWEQVKERGVAVWRNANEAPHMIVNDWWPTYPTPYDYLYILHGSNIEWNWSGYANSEYDDLIDRAFQLEGIDYKQSMEIYRKAQEIIFEDAVAISICDSIQPYIYDPDKILFRDGALNPIYMYVIFFQFTEVLS